jgi:AraC-like DNA-binding protein
MCGHRSSSASVSANIVICLILPLISAAAAPSCPALAQEPSGSGVASAQQLLDNIKTKTFTGRPIDLDLPNASLRDVIAALEKAGGFRLSMDPAIDARVIYRMRGIPWDEALATVLADNDLNIHIDLAGTGFKIFRGRVVALVFNEPGRAKAVMFLYKNVYWIAAGVVVLAGLAGFILYRRRRARRRQGPKKALLPAEAVEPVRKRLVHLLETERVYRDEGLTLQTLAAKLSVTPHQLSWVINDVLRCSFATLVNGYRVDEVKARLSDPSFNHDSILQAALDAGFGTKAAFNRAFKRATGKTPSEYKKSASA